MNTSRRKFIENSLRATVVATVSSPLIAKATSFAAPATAGAPNSLPPVQFAQVALPYAYNALEPNIDATTMDIHYNKHHATYIKNVNEAIAADKITFATEKEFFANASKLSAKAKNNGGGAWNHNFFWQVMAPASGVAAPTGKVGDAINASFSSFDKFKEQFTQAAMTRFGSGWAWLVSDNGKLKIGSTANQDNPLMDSSELKGTPLLALDVWEHAYYLKYQNKRNEYVANFWNVVNWNEVAKRLG
ncbi:superoxide dismutase [Chryseolinea lacunae]|uniref:Superoxide dismutase n=1 Tax=Chryseolinea lacunae TaxID=2801331 RepID=A0ABS1KQQ0_9BACT|nr:superoxide dismutase [Chryseolinea lacunae]MBL0741537.1 superoxide dismutase [Chryseolinea lacunae]